MLGHTFLSPARQPRLLLLLVVMLVTLQSASAQAGCDNIPTAIDQFRAAQGAVTAPYATPHQLLQVRVRPQICDKSSLGLSVDPSDLGSVCRTAADVRVTVLFTPGGGAPVSAAVLAADCTAVQSAVDDWNAQLSLQGGIAACYDQTSPENAPDLEVVRVEFGPSVAECRLNFRFPAMMVPGALSPDSTETGPSKIIVDLQGAPLPTTLADARCAEVIAGGARPSIACIDDLFETDGTCFTETENLHRRFANFTALPIPNDFAAMCTPDSPDSPCLGLQPDVRFTIDARGNVLAPVDWSGVLFEGTTDEGFLPPQLVSFFTSIGSGLPSPPGELIRIPESTGFLSSQTYQGKELPPIFDPLSDSSEAASLFGSTDAVRTVIRVQARAPGECTIESSGQRTGVACFTDTACGTGEFCGPSVCAGDSSVSCTRDADCADFGGTCGPAIFDLRYLRDSQAVTLAAAAVSATPWAGPLIIPSFAYGAATDGFIPLDGLNLCRSSTTGLSCILRDERLAGRSKNADADVEDPAVLTLRDRRTGAALPIGIGGADGLASVLLHEAPSPVGPLASPLTGPNVRPAVAGADECVALLFAEPWENFPNPAGTDANADGDIFSPILRVFCRDDAGGIDEVAADAAAPVVGPRLAAAAGPLILPSPLTLSPLQGGGEPLVIADSESLIYFLLDESANATKGDQRVDVSSLGVAGDGPARDVTLSVDGKVACFASEADNLVESSDKNRGGADIYCHDLDTGVAEVINRYQEPPPKRPLCEGRIIRANQPAEAPSVSGDGMRVCYQSAASNLVKGDHNKAEDVFVIDRVSCETVRVSVDWLGEEVGAPSRDCDMAADGLSVTFASDGELLPDDSDAFSDVYVRNLVSGDMISASAGLAGSARKPSLSVDGSRIAFEQVVDGVAYVVVRDFDGSDFVTVRRFEGQNPELSDGGRRLTFEATSPAAGVELFVLDLASGIEEPAALTSALVDIEATSFDGAISPSAVAFTSDADLVAGDGDGLPEVHVRDLVTRLLERRGTDSGSAALAADGSAIAYVAPTSSGTGIFWHGPDPGAPPADFDGNGSQTDTVLAAIDVKKGTLEVLGAATQAAVAGRTAAFVGTGSPPFASSVGPRMFVRYFPCGNASCLPTIDDLGPARAVAVSEEVACAQVGEERHIACAAVGSTPLVELLEGGLPISTEAMAVSGRLVVFTAVDETPARRLMVYRMADDGSFTPLFVGLPGTRRFVVSKNGFVAADGCEADVGIDLNADGIEDECVLDIIDPIAVDPVFATNATVLPCNLEACDRRFPWRIFPSGDNGTSATARFLTLECQECGACGPTPRTVEPCCDLNMNGSCDDIVVREITFDDRSLVLAQLGSDSASDPLAGPESGQGGLDQGAVVPALLGKCADDPTIACQTDANCLGAGEACIDLQPTVLALADSDGDGIFDGFDNCQFTYNPSQSNGDGDFAGDACDLFNCGDGIVEQLEYCDEGPLNGTPGGICTSDCTPVVDVDVSEQAVEPGKQGVLPGVVFGSPVLNLATVEVGGYPARMIDLGSVRLEALVAGAPCSGDGAGFAHDLSDPTIYASHLQDSNGDGILDLQVHFSIPDALVDPGDDEACLTGSFRRIEGRFRPATFEARDQLNVK
jgi:hypothetical protein